MKPMKHGESGKISISCLLLCLMLVNKNFGTILSAQNTTGNTTIDETEIWSVYFDDTISSVKSLDENGLRRRQQLIEMPFEEEKCIVQIGTFINEKNQHQIQKMEMVLCEMLNERDDDEQLIMESFPNGSIYQNEGNDSKKFACLQRLASFQSRSSGGQISNQTVVKFPDDVCLPIAKYKMNSTVQSVLLVIEYRSDWNSFFDDSGFDIYLQKKENQTFSGVLAVGFVSDHRFFIPPHLNNWSVQGVCHSRCLTNMNANNAINIVNVIPSTNHPFLEEMVVEISQHLSFKTDNEDGKFYKIFQLENELLEQDHSLEFNEEPVLTSEDRLNVRCRYRTDNKTTVGGFGSKHEHCLAWLHYYPAIKMDACLSSYSMATIMSMLNVQEMNFTMTRETAMDLMADQQPETRKPKLIQYLMEYDRTHRWNKEKLIRAKYSAIKGSQVFQCGWKESINYR